MNADSTLIRSGERRLTMMALRERGARAAAGLESLGLESGDGVALLLRNDFAFFEASLAARLAGVHVVPINWHFAGEEIRYILDDASIRAIVVHADLLPGVEAHLPAHVTALVVATPPEITEANGIARESCGVPGGRLDWDAWVEGFDPQARPASPPGTTMLYTSGTTGRPKGVRREPLEDEVMLKFYRSLSLTFGIEPGMRSVMTGPLYHSAPNGYANIGIRLGCDMLLMPRFDAESLLALIESERLSHMHMVPTMFVRLLRLPEATRNRYDLSSLRCITHGAAPCPIEVKRQMIEWWGPVFREYYGSTEGSLVAGSTSEEWLAKPGSVGRARPDAHIEIHDEEGHRLAPGEIGEIYFSLDPRPEFTYHGRDEERAAIERNGLLTNGDIGYLDEDGYLFLCDRKRDMIISGGVNIYPAEIESAALAHPMIRDCAVFGIPDTEYGESVAAAVELEPGAHFSADELRDYLADRIARYKLPREIKFHDSLPRQDNGKIYKHELRAPYWEGAGRRI